MILEQFNKTHSLGFITKVSAFAFCATVVSAFFSSLLFSEVFCIAAGIVLFLLGILCHVKGKEIHRLYFLNIFMNAIASGLFIGFYYIAARQKLSIIDIGLSALIGVILFSLAWFAYKIPVHKGFVNFLIILFIISLLVLLLIGWQKNGEHMFAFSFFMTIFLSFFLIVFYVTVLKKRNFLRDLSFGSFGAFCAVAIAVILIVTEGDALEGFEFGGEAIDGIGSKKKTDIKN